MKEIPQELDLKLKKAFKREFSAKKKIQELKGQIQTLLGDEGAHGEYHDVTFIDATETKSVDWKKLQAERPEWLTNFIADYVEIRNKKACYRYNKHYKLS